MSDIISRELAIELLENTIPMTKKEERRRNYCVELIKAMPSAYPKKGKWIISKVNGQYQCSNCGMFTGLTAEDINEGFHLMNYCGNCGSKNIEESNDD